MRAIVPFAAGVVAALAAGWVAFPRVIEQAQPQPVNFSHKVHAEKAGTACQDCHSLRADGSFAGTPTLDKCSGCHAAAMGTTAAEKNFIDRYVTPNRQPRWRSYAGQPENVFFSHAAHLKLAGLQCEACHRPEGSTDGLRPVRLDRISGYSRETLSMDGCIACHRQKGLELSCLECHQ